MPEPRHIIMWFLPFVALHLKMLQEAQGVARHISDILWNDLQGEDVIVKPHYE